MTKISITDWIRSYPLTKLVGIMIIAMVLLQIIAFLITPLVPSAAQIKLGPGFIIFGVAIAVIAPFYFIFQRQTLEKRDILMIILLIGAVLFLSIYLKKLLPEIFESSASSLMAVFGG